MISIIEERAFEIRHRFGQYIHLKRIILMLFYIVEKKFNLYFLVFFSLSISRLPWERKHWTEFYWDRYSKEPEPLVFFLKYVLFRKHVSNLNAITKARTNWKRQNFIVTIPKNVKITKGNSAKSSQIFARKHWTTNETERRKCLVSFKPGTWKTNSRHPSCVHQQRQTITKIKTNFDRHNTKFIVRNEVNSLHWAHSADCLSGERVWLKR